MKSTLCEELSTKAQNIESSISLNPSTALAKQQCAPCFLSAVLLRDTRTQLEPVSTLYVLIAAAAELLKSQSSVLTFVIADKGAFET